MRQRSDHQAEAIATSIKQLIVAAKITVGDRLPPEVDLCKRYGTGRHTVRKAMTILEREGLVARFVGRGTFVTGSITGPLPAPNAGAATPRPTWSLHEVTEARMILEPHLAGLMAERRTQDDLTKLEDCLARIVESDDWATFGEAKYAFHLTLVKTAKNRFLDHVFEQIILSRRESAWPHRETSGALIGKVKEICIQECRSILDALRGKNAKLAQREIENSILRVLMWISET
jgi:DNA-binding FadR family transcriptional regulator